MASTFQPTLLLRGATAEVANWRRLDEFQPTPPLRGATFLRPSMHITSVFKSTLPSQGATSGAHEAGASTMFQSTLPLRGATPPPRWARPSWSCFNPRSPCGERLGCRVAYHRVHGVSIHAPRAGSDRVDRRPLLVRRASIPVPRAGSDRRGA